MEIFKVYCFLERTRGRKKDAQGLVDAKVMLFSPSQKRRVSSQCNAGAWVFRALVLGQQILHRDFQMFTLNFLSMWSLFYKDWTKVSPTSGMSIKKGKRHGRSWESQVYMDYIVNGQPSATNPTRLNRGGMLSVKRQSHVLRHVMALRWFGTSKSCAFG